MAARRAGETCRSAMASLTPARRLPTGEAKSKRLTRSARDQFHPGQGAEREAAFRRISMMRCGPCAEHTEHEQSQEPSAANNYRQKYCHHGATGVGLVGACQSDARANQRPDAGNQSTTNGHHLQRTSRTLRKSEDTEGSFKWLVRAANNHQTKMHDCTADEQTDYDEQRQQNDDCHGANSHPSHCGKAVLLIFEQADRVETQRKQKRDESSYASADERINERFAQATFALHNRKRFSRFGKDDGQRLDECANKSALLAVLPRQASARCHRC